MRIIINTPNYKFGSDLKKSAPIGISVMVGCQAGNSPEDANVPAVALMGFNKTKPAEVSKEHFIRIQPANPSMPRSLDRANCDG